MTFKDLYEFKTDSPVMKLIGGITASEQVVPVDYAENVKNGGGLTVNSIAVIRGTVANVEQFEAVQVTARSVATGPGNLTVIRGWGGTTPQAWSSGTEMCCVITAKQMNDICDNVKELSVLEGETAGENLALYEIVYKSIVDGKWYKCDTDAYEGVKGFVGVVIKEALANATFTVQMRGTITNPVWNFTPAGAVYPSQYAGTITQDLHAKQLAVGFAVSATTIYFTGIALSDLLNALVPVVPVTMGGTGQSTVKAARVALLPTTAVARRVPMWDTDEDDYTAQDLYVPGVIPFYEADGTYQPITLTEQGTMMPFQKADGTSLTIPVRETESDIMLGLSDGGDASDLHVHDSLYPRTLKAYNPNLIINGDFSVAQRGTSFTSATWRPNSDDSYLLDRWLLLSDGNDIVDVTQIASPFSRSRYALQAEVETANKRFGFCQIIEANTCIPLRGQKVSISFAVKTLADKVINNVRVAVLEWTSTADTVTSDVVSNWASDLTWAANWAALNTPANLALTTSAQTFKVEDLTVGSLCNNLAVFVWVDDTDCAADDILQLGEVQVVRGSVVPEFVVSDHQTDVLNCLYRFELTRINTSWYYNGYYQTESTLQFLTKKAYNPTITILAEGSGTAWKIRDQTTSVDINASIASQSNAHVRVYATDNNMVASRQYGWYAAVEAEL